MIVRIYVSHIDPSQISYVMVSVPSNPLFGVYVKLPSALPVNDPLAALLVKI